MATRILLLFLACFASLAQITNVNIGTSANDNAGDSLRTAFSKVNTNTAWLASQLGSATNSVSALSNLVGVVGPGTFNNVAVKTNLTLNSVSALRGLVIDSNSNVVASTATKQQVDKSAMQVATVADLVALSTNLNNGQLIQIGGYYTNGDGGQGAYRVDLSDTTSASDGGSVLVTGSGVRIKAIFDSDYVDVRRFGVKANGVDSDNAAVQAALTWQQNSTNQMAGLFFPAGRTLISQSLVASIRPLRIKGVGPASISLTTASVIEMTADNVPIVRISLRAESVEDVWLRYQNLQASANTNAACIKYENQSYRSIIQRVHIGRGAYGIYSESGTTSWNHAIRDCYINGFTVSAVSLKSAGTEWVIDNLYVQNLDGASATTGSITGFTRSGVNLTITCSSLPPLLQVGAFLRIQNVDSTYNAAYVVKGISGNNVEVTMTSDPGYTPAPTANSQIYFGAQSSAAGAFELGPGWIGAIHGLDIEHNVSSISASVLIGCQSVFIDSIHLEELYSSSATHRVIYHYLGSLSIGAINWLNSGFKTGQSAVMLYEDGPSATSATDVGSVAMRDIALSGTSLSLTDESGSSLPVALSRFVSGVTLRENAVSTPTTFGNVTYRTRSKDLETLSASSGEQVSVSETVNVNQSGTAGFVAFSRSALLSATGSGSKLVDAVYGGVSGNSLLWSVSSDGDGSIKRDFYSGGSVFVTANSASIVATSTNQTTALFRGDLSTENQVELVYGQSVDRKMQITGNGVQSTVASTGSAANMNAQVSGGYLVVGSGSSGSGLRVSSTGTGMSRVKFGTAVLAGGTATVSDSTVTASSVIFLTGNADGGTPGWLRVSARSAGVSFTITSSSGTDTSSVAWVMFEP